MPFNSSPPWYARRLTFVSAVALVILVTCLAYTGALHGPYLLDDVGNLDPLRRWLEGSLSTRAVLLDNRSGPTGRPLTMITFLADAWRTRDMHSFTFKPTNLIIHLLCGLLIFVLVAQLFGLHQPPRAHTKWVALTVTAIWLWMPMHVSTVLYVIQRMAQLSTLWTLATMVLFLHIRPKLAVPGNVPAMSLLWVGVPLLTAAAMLSKENGVLALPLVGLIEWTMFAGSTRTRTITGFFAATIVVPCAFAAGYALDHMSFFVTSFAGRDFTVGERLLTESRILWSYLRTTFFPVGSRMGIFHDNYPVSTSILHPVSTLVSLTAWLGMTIWAIAWRRRAPLFTLGVLGYLVAHALEAGPIALELYFEHRNYLPSVFALIGCLGLIVDVSTRHHFTMKFRRATGVALVFFLATFGLGTWNHASAWASADEFYTLQYDYNPTSPRLLSVLTGRAMIAKDLPESLAAIDAGERYSKPSERATATLWRFLAYCEVGDTPVPERLYDELQARSLGRITQFAMTAWDLLADRVSAGCPLLDSARVAKSGLTWLQVAPQAPTEQPVWRTRYNVARLLANAGDIERAESQGYRAWVDSGRNNGVGVLVFELSASRGNVGRCREVLSALERSYGLGDASLDEAIRGFRQALQETIPAPAS